MPTPLDDDRPETDKRTTYPVFRAIGYLALMLLGEVAFEYWFTRQLSSYSLRPILAGFFFPVLISTILELLRCLLRRFKQRKEGVWLNNDPLWFQIIEGAMAIWILFLLATFIRLHLP